MKNTRTATNAFSLHNGAEFRKIESSKIAKAIRANSGVIG